MTTASSRSKGKQKDGGKLTEKTIERHVGERSFRLGQEYFASDSIFRARREGDALKACCRGQSADHYVLSARVKGSRIVEADCSCPVGDGGQCKHMAALLLAALKSPEEFLKSDPLAQRLAECDKPKLVELMMQMIEQVPDLESWLELALPTAIPSHINVSPQAYRQQTTAAFASAGYGWEADRQLTAALQAIRKIGDQFRAQKNAASAAAVYGGIIEGFISDYETFQDETGNVTGVACQCIASLGECLPELAAGSEARESAIKTLFDLLKYDIDYGGIGLSDDVPEILKEQATPTERAMIAKWIRAQPRSDKFSSEWKHKNWGGLLLDIEGEPDDDEAFIKHCREFGLAGDLVERLLKRGRLDDALQEIRKSNDYEAMGLADRLVAHKHADLAHTVVRERLTPDRKSRNDWQLREWLKRFYQSRKDWPSLLQLEMENFQEKPTLAGYQEIRKVAQKLKTWDALRPKLLSTVPSDSAELIRIHVDEGDVGQAIQLLESRPKKRVGAGFGWDRVDLEVAKAAEKSHPEAALKLYQTEVERQIAGRSRGAYQDACKYLKKVQRLFNVLARSDYWTEYLSALRDRHRSLRALQDEISRAKL